MKLVCPRSRRVEHADEVFPPVAQQIARRAQIVEGMDLAGRRTLALQRGDAVDPVQPRAIVAPRLEHARRGLLALAAHDAIDGAAGVLEQLARDEGGAVPAD